MEFACPPHRLLTADPWPLTSALSHPESLHRLLRTSDDWRTPTSAIDQQVSRLQPRPDI